MKALKPLITAHSGCNDTEDNSFEHIYSAINSSADIIEVDIDMSKDKVLVLSHDPFIYKNSGHFEKTSNVINNILRKNGVISLEEVLKDINMKIHLNLDLKSEDVIEPVITLLKKLNYTEKIIFSGCSSSWVMKLRELDDNYAIFLNSQEFEYLTKEDISIFNKTLIKIAIKTGAIGININYKLCNENLVYNAHLNGLFVQVWTVDRKEDMKKMIRMNVDGITTHYPSLLKLLKEVDE
ncbi:glycerophosphoryl diester phosphodiesterase [Marinitoga hydrogenitolerans DSM 16785]|uniref:Glycerophosphoryl diester phosphodiesterase n=1 Tax=Marinitoga hydrogenitolerans (strain DSM 16785 / JCM 12826 / AT1271) TaxID=1122195 RepID=A0A1M4SID1_MARH1|nr:glycerophosphodiester phosphodiesterase [Marinitoga hydrogenitolerans]SHE31965.1 glycerophosphoryl diester phosphodiesterase [Marinitoga hydrogenitolerans DSM 16785]